MHFGRLRPAYLTTSIFVIDDWLNPTLCSLYPSYLIASIVIDDWLNPTGLVISPCTGASRPALLRNFHLD